MRLGIYVATACSKHVSIDTSWDQITALFIDGVDTNILLKLPIDIRCLQTGPIS